MYEEPTEEQELEIQYTYFILVSNKPPVQRYVLMPDSRGFPLNLCFLIYNVENIVVFLIHS